MIATDQVRQVVRAFFSHEFMPAVHHSSFDVAQACRRWRRATSRATIDGFLRQVEDIAPGIDALVERAVSEREPDRDRGRPPAAGRAEPAAARAGDHGAGAAGGRATSRRTARTSTCAGLQAPRPPERYLEAFDRIRTLQDHLIERARRRPAYRSIDEGGLEPTLKRVMELVLDAVGTDEPSSNGNRDGNVSDRESERAR